MVRDTPAELAVALAQVRPLVVEARVVEAAVFSGTTTRRI
jgi:hypothetical protein